MVAGITGFTTVALMESFGTDGTPGQPDPGKKRPARRSLAAVCALALIVTVGSSFAFLGGRSVSRAEVTTILKADCTGAKTHELCVDEAYETYVDDIGSREFLLAYADIGTDESLRLCHTVMHHVGKMDAEKGRGGVLEATDELCQNGYLHGYIIGSASTSVEHLREDVVKDCGKLEASHPNQFGECLHAVGHALIEQSKLSLPKALEFCGETGTPDRCAIGAGMSWSSTNFDIGPIGQEDDTFEAEEIKAIWAKAGCETQSIPDLLTSCYSAVTEGASQQLHAPTDWLRGQCQSMVDGAALGCVSGLSRGIADRYLTEGADANKARAVSVCSSLSLTKHCFETYGMQIGVRHGDADLAARVCTELLSNAEAIKSCGYGADRYRELLNAK